MRDSRTPLSRAKARFLSRGLKFDIMIIGAVAVLLLAVILLAPRAEAQVSFPRLGMSASAESYVDSLTVTIGEPFTVYVCAFGFEPGEALDQEISVLQWAIHQVCCGAIFETIDTEYNPAFTHVGSPHMGVSSSSETCVTEDAIWLATITAVLDAPEPGDYLAVAGPIDAAFDCEGNNPLFMDMPMTLTATGDITPVVNSAWGAVKAVYR
jgi:hypothetical protein